jgi:predicted secreted protein
MNFCNIAVFLKLFVVLPFVAASALATFNDALTPIASAAATVDIATAAVSSTMAQSTFTKHPFCLSHFSLATVS